MITHGTDSGPACKRCTGTVWGYELCAPRTWRAWCAGCHLAMYFHAATARTTVRYVVRQHAACHAEAHEVWLRNAQA